MLLSTPLLPPPPASSLACLLAYPPCPAAADGHPPRLLCPPGAPPADPHHWYRKLASNSRAQHLAARHQPAGPAIPGGRRQHWWQQGTAAVAVVAAATADATACPLFNKFALELLSLQLQHIVPRHVHHALISPLLANRFPPVHQFFTTHSACNHSRGTFPLMRVTATCHLQLMHALALLAYMLRKDCPKAHRSAAPRNDQAHP